MKKHSIITILSILTLFNSCKNEPSQCTELSPIVNELSIEIQEYYTEIHHWDEHNARMRFLKPHIEIFEEEFSRIQTSIESQDELSFTESKATLLDQISIFLYWTSNIEIWVNNQYFWIIERIKTDLNKFTLHTKGEVCSEIDKLKSYQIEKELISTFYLLGYSDQYCFNKSEPILKPSKWVGVNDTTSFTVGHFAYDSTECSKLNVRIENGNNVIEDSSSCNWIHVPDNMLSGANTFKGTVKFYLYGKEFTRAFKFSEHFE